MRASTVLERPPHRRRLGCGKDGRYDQNGCHDHGQNKHGSRVAQKIDLGSVRNVFFVRLGTHGDMDSLIFHDHVLYHESKIKPCF